MQVRATNRPRPARPAWAAIALLCAGAAHAMNEDVDPKFQGIWVPAGAACASPLKVVIEARKVSFVNGAQRADYSRLETCASCAAGGMSTARQPLWLTTDQMGDSPWQLTLDDTRKGRVAVTADFPNDRKMAARFPLGTAALKKCP